MKKVICLTTILIALLKGLIVTNKNFYVYTVHPKTKQTKALLQVNINLYSYTCIYNKLGYTGNSFVILIKDVNRWF